ncbi:MAG: cation transporter [Ignavibacteriae bacterium]|nr:cation transporter [Ignavibacteriota bacterium]
MKEIKFMTLGSIVAAIVASLCCIGPLVFVFLGIGSIGAFSAFEAFRPYLIGITALLLGLAFYFTYRKRKIHCEDGTCTTQSAGKWNKVGVWVVTVVAVLALLFPYFDLTPSTSANDSVVPIATAFLNIKGMDCKACAVGVEGMLISIEGVHQAKVDFEKGSATVQFDPNLVKPEVFVERVNETSYEATITQIEKGK